MQVQVLPDRPRSGQNVTLSCRSSPSNPPSKIRWWQGGERLEGALESVVDLETDGRKGGAVTESVVTLTVSARHNAAAVTCEADNGVTGARAHDAVTLSVQRESENAWLSLHIPPPPDTCLLGQ